MSIIEALVAIQGELKAPKDQKTSRYRYRNIEDINEAVKPLAAKQGCAVTYTDAFHDGVCVSTCTLLGSDGSISADGCAYVNTDPSNMSVEQASGAASSYARKYAACGLFAIDSSENDPDKTNAQAEHRQKPRKAASKNEVSPDELAMLWNECRDLGVTQKGLMSWYEAQGYGGKKFGQLHAIEREQVKAYLLDMRESIKQVTKN